MPRRRIRTHYELLSEFERGRIVGLKEEGWAHAHTQIGESLVICFEAMRPLKDAVFSDESRFHLCPGDHRRRVWRRPWQRVDPAFPNGCHTGPQQGVTVWGVISFEARPRWSSLEAHLQHIGTSTLIKPSLIEHVWDMMERQLHPSGNVDDLARQLEQIWQEIPQETIRVLYHCVTSCGSSHLG
ncbi:transposable element Tc1 transposase [Trichonephila clavipes]|nr:transposable element Tc1 transposase [Trichonephila clavipes]